MAGTAKKTGFPGIEIHGRSIRVDFMYKGVRHRHTLGMEPTKNNIKHAARLRSAALFALKSGNYNEAEFFPHSRPSESVTEGKRLGDLCDRYKPNRATKLPSTSVWTPLAAIALSIPCYRKTFNSCAPT